MLRLFLFLEKEKNLRTPVFKLNPKNLSFKKTSSFPAPSARSSCLRRLGAFVTPVFAAPDHTCVKLSDRTDSESNRSFHRGIHFAPTSASYFMNLLRGPRLNAEATWLKTDFYLGPILWTSYFPCYRPDYALVAEGSRTAFEYSCTSAEVWGRENGSIWLGWYKDSYQKVISCFRKIHGMDSLSRLVRSRLLPDQPYRRDFTWLGCLLTEWIVNLFTAC